MDSHEKYLELCAASTAGELSAGEEQKLEEHFAVCASCRRAKHEFESAVQRAVPALADELASNPEQCDPAWPVEQAEKAFFKRLETHQNTGAAAQGAVEEPETETAGRRFTYRPSRIPWAELWMPVAACALLAIALGIVAYRSGLKRDADTTQKQAVTTTPSTASLEERISDAGYERARLLATLAHDDQAIKDLQREVTLENDEIKRLRDVNDSAVANGSDGISRRDAELVSAETSLKELQAKGAALSEQRDAAASHAAVLEAKVDDLTQRVRERDQVLEQQQAQLAKQQELLDHDRDIRELMGARDLYIADVHDVAETAKTDKTYGRIFYTKGKSLIFYAYDLDQEAGLKSGSTFQAWGRRGADKQEALSLGVFYEDNPNKKRWILKFDDPKAMATIDAVFVTVEPNGGSHHPSGKELIFAYLRVNPNHP
jgi:Anti-sigma-K factor rskA/Putative zinc-finger